LARTDRGGDDMNEMLVLVAVFVAVLILSFAVINLVLNNREKSKNIDAVESATTVRESDEYLDRMLSSENKQVLHYFDVMKKDRPNGLKIRLVQAGFFSTSALAYFNMIRVGLALGLFLLSQFLVAIMVPSASKSATVFFAMAISGVAFILASWVLERMGRKRSIEYRKLFPDFMDLLIVCVDAGLSIEAALDRVTREFLLTKPDFGIQLSIIGLEVRAGRRLHEALAHFAVRVNVEEARALSILFRQSEELGSSISKTLRTFSKEMRQMRLIRAEEKANALPIKMLFPTALFLFPANLIIVLVPIIMAILKMLQTMAPT
jgi:tight adherence protein C